MNTHNIKSSFEKKGKRIAIIIGVIIITYVAITVYASYKGTQNKKELERIIEEVHTKENITSYMTMLGVEQDKTANRCGEALTKLEEWIKECDYEKLYYFLNTDYLKESYLEITYEDFKKGMEEEYDSEKEVIFSIISISEPLQSGGIIVKYQILKERNSVGEIGFDTINTQTKTMTFYVDKEGRMKRYLPFAEPLIERYQEQYHMTKIE